MASSGDKANFWIKSVLWVAVVLLTACQDSGPGKGGQAEFVHNFEEDAGPVYLAGEHRLDVKPLTTPQEVLEKIPKTELPAELHEVGPNDIQIELREFRLNVDREFMLATVVVRDGEKVDQVQLRGSFQRQASSWRAELVPTDRAWLDQIFSVAACFTPYSCRPFAIDVRLRRGGKVTKRQFQLDVELPAPLRGDALPEPIVPGPQPMKPMVESEPVAMALQPVLQLPVPSRGDFLTEKEIEVARRFSSRARPVVQRAQAIGLHWQGRMRDAAEVPVAGEGYRRHLVGQVLPGDVDNQAIWSTDHALRIFTEVAREFGQKQPRKELVLGPVSARYGGPLAFARAMREREDCRKAPRRRWIELGCSHISHQNGLDLDVHYVKGAQGQIDVKDNWELFKLFAAHPDEAVVVIFIDRQIKQQICQLVRQSGEDLNDKRSLTYRALRLLRHETGHRDHFHVRLDCPSGEAGVGCARSRVILPPGTGC